MTQLTPDLLEFVVGWLPPPPARVLEVGCGEGELARRLDDAGYAVTGIDPEAPDEEGFIRTDLESFAADAPFDAAVASRSLHHLGDLDQALASLRDALRPGARLVVYEFASEALDGAAHSWLESVGLEYEPELHDVVALARLRAALSPGFRELVSEPAAYLARELGREDLHGRETAAITAGELQPTAFRLAYERRA
jgi:SAM-dependent methyltransferase